LEDVVNGNDGAPTRAAKGLRTLCEKTRSRDCPYCDGTGELHD
jgi:CDGSH-type Zn-finger protein